MEAFEIGKNRAGSIFNSSIYAPVPGFRVCRFPHAVCACRGHDLRIYRYLKFGCRGQSAFRFSFCGVSCCRDYERAKIRDDAKSSRLLSVIS